MSDKQDETTYLHTLAERGRARAKEARRDRCQHDAALKLRQPSRQNNTTQSARTPLLD